MSRWDRLVGIADKYDGDFGLQTFIEEKDITYEESKATNPEFFAGAKWFVVAHAERVFVYRALPNGTTPGKQQSPLLFVRNIMLTTHLRCR